MLNPTNLVSYISNVTITCVRGFLYCLYLFILLYFGFSVFSRGGEIYANFQPHLPYVLARPLERMFAILSSHLTGIPERLLGIHRRIRSKSHHTTLT